MPSRHRSRQRALQILFLLDMGKQPVEDAIKAFYDSLYADAGDRRQRRDRFMEQLATGAAAKTPDMDQLIAAHSEHWRLERMPAVDRNILRLAVYEMLGGETPPAVVIDEALELARQFSGEESVAFVNGVLDAVRKAVVSSQ